MEEQPLSPWAGRFEGTLPATWRPKDILKKDVQEHSGLAIEFPRLDPKFYHDPVPDARKFERPSNGVELDRLFSSEYYQRKYLHGTRSWQGVLINRWLGPSPFGLLSGGHTSTDDVDFLRAMVERDQIKVDETKWFRFLQKNRWYDLVEDENHPTVPAPRGGPWSVDNPTVWNELSVCLELADRILKALVSDRHVALETVLFGRIRLWHEIGPFALSAPNFPAPVLLSPEMEKEIATVEDSAPFLNECERLPEAERGAALARKLEQLCYGTAWSFFTQEEPSDTSGLTWKFHRGSVTCLPTEMIRRLYENDLTPAERYLIQYHVSITIIHEVMHAIIHRRYLLLNSQLPARSGETAPIYPEPFIDFDPIAEVGEAMEQRLFGGQTAQCPTPTGVPIHSILVQWPTPLLQGGISNPNDYRMKNAAPITIELTPAMEAARLFSASFWDNPDIPRKSDNYFHRTTLFQSTSYTTPNWPSFGPPPVWDEFYVNRQEQNNWKEHEQAIVSTWLNKSTQWNHNRRDWYDTHLNRWAATPWSLYIPRNYIENFNDAFKKRDEVACCRFAMRMGVNAPGHPMNWERMSLFFKGMPSDTRLRNHWVFYAIGLLMLAALPIKTKNVGVEDRSGQVQTFSLSASVYTKQAVRRGWYAFGSTIQLQNPYEGVLEEVVRPANVFYDPFEQDPFEPYGQAVPDPTQMDYLDLVDKILSYMHRWQAIVSGPWFREILTLARGLRRQRQEIIDEYPVFHNSLWAKSWKFTVPTYNPEDLNWIQWDNATQQWGSCTFTPDYVRQ